MSASIKITLYSDEGPDPTIVSNASSRKETAQIEWSAIVGTARHLLRTDREQLSEAQFAALDTLVALDTLAKAHHDP